MINRQAERGRHALLIVDIQPDFLPGGALGVAEGDQILEPIRALLARDEYDLYVATQDWHPPDHISFASQHPGKKPFDVIDLYGHEQVLWPDHCVQGSSGAALSTEIPWNKISAIIRKGAEREVDSYSGFRNNWSKDGTRPPTGLAGYLRERGITHVTLCGLARDYCVKWSSEDAVAAGFNVTVLWDLTRPVDPRSNDAVLARLKEIGVEVR